MDKQKKGLTDTGQEGEFILNESGTSVSTDPVLPMTQPSVQTEIITEFPSDDENDYEDESDQGRAEKE